jgi:regulator of RNase E activity RraB
VNEAQTSRAAAIIAKQLAMNAQSLSALQQAGLKPDTVVQLDFTFVAPSRDAGAALKAHLEENDCLDVELRKRPGLFSRKADVVGKSQPTTVDAEILDQWVRWMVVQGVSHGCDFDGWGTFVPR